MNKRENHCETDYFSRTPGVSEAASWKLSHLGTAVCTNEACEHKTGTYLGKPRTGREFDFSSAIVKQMVQEGRKVYCADTACQKVQDRERAKRKRLVLRARKKAPVQAGR